MKEEQLNAIKRLEAAFQGCRLVGLCFIGMDDEVLAFDLNELLDAGWNNEPHVAMKALGQGTPVNTYGSYKDSGGW
jgi:hypothetical protein